MPCSIHYAASGRRDSSRACGAASRACGAALLLLLARGAAAPAAAAALPSYARYVVLGAGPGGLQLAHYLESAGRDYVVLEANAEPASFFARFPRWRQLISINKGEVGRVDSLAFAERHDWNSLLTDASHAAGGLASTTDARLDVASVDPVLRFPSHSREYFPHADALRGYMAAFATAADGCAVVSDASGGGGSGGDDGSGSGGDDGSGSGGSGNSSRGAPCMRGLGRSRALRIAYNTTVVRIARPAGYAAAYPPRGNASTSASAAAAGALAAGAPRFELTTAGGARVACTFLVVASGLSEAVVPSGAGVREALAEGWLQTYASAPADAEAYRGQRVLLLGRGNAAFEWADALKATAAFVHVLGRSAGRVRLAAESHYPGDVRAVHAQLLESYLLKSLDGLAEVAFEQLRFARDNATGAVLVSDDFTPCARDAHGRASARCFFRVPYDAVIACTGWRFAGSAFDAAVRPALHANGKHPAISARYEAVGVAGLFVAGTASHAMDAKKSAGGFIHGFRYTARALHRVLEEEERAVLAAARGGSDVVRVSAGGGGGSSGDGDGSDGGGGSSSGAPLRLAGRPPAGWPHTELRGLRAIVAALLRRANAAAGPYQLFGALADVLLLDPVAAAAGRPAAAAASVAAAMHEPWSFFDARAAAADAAADPSGLAADIRSQQLPAPERAATATAAAATAAAEARVQAALRGALYEEVPVLLAPDQAARWARERGARDGDAVEWCTLTLEFGPVPPPRVRGEWAQDPYSRLRANVGLGNPEASRFLHPVLRFFRAPLQPRQNQHQQLGARPAAPVPTPEPALVLHVIEDFLSAWDQHLAHVLPIARFLQDVGSRRADAAAAAATAAAAAAAASTALRPLGAATADAADAAADAAAAAAAIWAPPRALPPTPHAALVEALMASPNATLFLGGRAFAGGPGWRLALSVAACDALLHDAPLVAVHYVDAAPHARLSPAEAAYTAAARAEAVARAGAAGLFTPRTVRAVPPPASSSSAEGAARARDAAGLLAHLHASYAALTAAPAARGLPIVLLLARSGPARLLAEDLLGPARAAALPVLRTYDKDAGAAEELDGADLAAAPAAIAAAWRAAVAARAAPGGRGGRA